MTDTFELGGMIFDATARGFVCRNCAVRVLLHAQTSRWIHHGSGRLYRLCHAHSPHMDEALEADPEIAQVTI